MARIRSAAKVAQHADRARAARRKAAQTTDAAIAAADARTEAWDSVRGTVRALTVRVRALEDFMWRLEDVVTILDRRTRHLPTPPVILPPATATPPARVPPKEACKVRKLTDADASRAFVLMNEHTTCAQDAEALNEAGFRRVVKEGS